MKKCPFCAEEIQDEAIVCKHCGRELIPQAVKPISTITDNPKIALASQKYAQRDYKVISVTTDQIVMERPASREPWWSILIWFLIFWPIGLLILVIDLLKPHKTYRVQLSMDASGEVKELGDTIAVYERDRLQASYTRHLGFGIFFGILGGLVILFYILIALFNIPAFGLNELGPKTLMEYLGFLATWTSFLMAAGLVTIAPAIALLLRSKKIKRERNDLEMRLWAG